MNEEIVPILKQLFSAYPHAQISEGTVAVYLRLLADIAPDDLQTVVDQAIAQHKFLPTVAELREMYHNLTRALSQLTAAEAWGLVVKGFRTHGRSASAQEIFSGLTLQAVEILGWRYLCDSEDQMADRAHFLRVHEQIQGRLEQMHKLLPAARALLPEPAQHNGPKRIADLLRQAQVAPAPPVPNGDKSHA